MRLWEMSKISVIGAGIAVGAVAIYSAYKLMERHKLAKIIREEQLFEEKMRVEAANHLCCALFFQRLEKLKSSLDGVLITPNYISEYMKARRRPFNQDMRGTI